jgi:hypothetical protein
MSNNLVDAALYRVELDPADALSSLGQFQDWGSEHLILMSASNHELRQTDKKSLRVLGITRIAIVVFEDLE